MTQPAQDSPGDGAHDLAYDLAHDVPASVPARRRPERHALTDPPRPERDPRGDASYDEAHDF